MCSQCELKILDHFYCVLGCQNHSLAWKLLRFPKYPERQSALPAWERSTSATNTKPKTFLFASFQVTSLMGISNYRKLCESFILVPI